MRSRGGNFGIMTAILLPVLIVAAGGAVDLVSAYHQQLQMQAQLDGAILAAAKETDSSKQQQTVTSFMSAFDEAAKGSDEKITLASRLSVKSNSDGSLTGQYNVSHPASFLGLIGIQTMPISVQSTAIGTTSTGTSSAASCIYVLANKSQAVLINSGANVKSTACRVDVASSSAPAFIMNSGSTINTAKFCVKGTNYIKNGGTLSNLEVGCTVNTDPYAGKLPEPTVSSTCTDSGTKDGNSFSLEPGVHCNLTFNGSPTITFKPGLHVIKGRMIVNSGSTINATGVTFYFPDVYSEIRANGNLTFTGTAPTTGTYKGILMFEKTSDSSNNSNKQQYIFNGSNGETLQGIIYLPNRDVTYNSTTNQTNRISLVVNTMIMNSANWTIEPYTGGSSADPAGSQTLRLIK